MRPLVCECGKTYTTGTEAVEHAKTTLHKVSGLYFSQRKEVEEYFHARGFCMHEPQTLDSGAVTVCIATTPLAGGGKA